jgi:hypothetical protein
MPGWFAGVLTAIPATGVSLAAVAVNDHGPATFLGLVVPSRLWIGQVSSQEGRQRTAAWLRPLITSLTFPLRQLYDRMGDRGLGPGPGKRRQ